MKLPRWRGRAKREETGFKLHHLSLLSLPLIAFVGSVVWFQSNEWLPQPLVTPSQTPPKFDTTEFSTVLSNFDLSFANVCRQGRKLGIQASTSPVKGSERPADFESTLAEIAPSWKTKLAAAPFPQIHGRARLAKVPIMMYHDILAEKQVFFDVIPEEFESALQLIRKQGVTPISLDQLVEHLKTGIPLPKKPILLTFDDGYEGHYTYVYRLLKKYNYPGAFSIYPSKVGTKKGRSSLSWAQLKEMAADPLITIASHSLTHPPDLTQLSDAKLQKEVVESKQILERELGKPIRYFIYPEGKNDARVQEAVKQAGYEAAWTMNDGDNRFAGESENLLNLDRIGQSQLEKVIDQADGGPPLKFVDGLNFYSPVELNRTTVNKVPLILASGGKPITIHADTRAQVGEIIANTKAVAAVDGGFFSLEALDSNKMIGPVFSRKTGKFVPGNRGEIPLIKGRPLVLINDQTIEFVPFDPAQHNTQAGVEAVLPGATDAFVGAAWLVKNGQPQPTESFGKLFGFDAQRDRAFWGIDWADRPVVGVSGDFVDSVTLGQALSQAGLKEVVMLDSGASASLVYKGESMMSYTPRPVPHVVALMPPETVEATSTCEAALPLQDPAADPLQTPLAPLQEPSPFVPLQEPSR
jgi:peptidoglycan/xylan/chitin deacetylase (PgdA/CDA1 family)